VQTGVNGIRGPATPGGANPIGGVGNATDLNLAQQIRAQLLTGGMGSAAGVGAGATTPATSQARALGAIRPESLRNVQISANNGAITLGGTVGSEAERRLLESRVRRMTGVNTIQNNLTVSGAGGQLRGQGVGPGTTTGVGTGRGTAIGNGSETVEPNNSRPSTAPIPR